MACRCDPWRVQWWSCSSGGNSEHGSTGINNVVDAYGNCYNKLDTDGVLAALQKRITYQRAWSEMFDDIDVLVMPTSMQVAFENDLDFKRPEDIPLMLEAQQPLCTVNFLGLPAVAMPTSVHNGLTLGVQLIGAMHDDHFVLEIAERLEQTIGTVLDQLPNS